MPLRYISRTALRCRAERFKNISAINDAYAAMLMGDSIGPFDDAKSAFCHIWFRCRCCYDIYTPRLITSQSAASIEADVIRRRRLVYAMLRLRRAHTGVHAPSYFAFNSRQSASPIAATHFFDFSRTRRCFDYFQEGGALLR